MYGRFVNRPAFVLDCPSPYPASLTARFPALIYPPLPFFCFASCLLSFLLEIFYIRGGPFADFFYWVIR